MDINKEKFSKQLGANIAKYRQKSKLTQEQLAELLGIGNEAVSRIERGVVIPSLIRLIEFANIFKCSLTDLITRKSERVSDENDYILALLQDLEKADRDLIIELIEKFASHLKNKQK
ncbi:transcriptional regulator [Mergibacter septicus]|uniref:helix-turn-helix domain-containing protein n=1 Tax=Mergibacter septicus TaxID=221402 RepID=UPI001179392C|nr:helix-turn-helix transcriptional regulator [Mergibacter septicus]AWX13403.1 transcriptional regulator [Mergibacter septicus]